MTNINIINKISYKYIQQLPQKDKIIAEYVWIDGTMDVRSKARTLSYKVSCLSDIPEWNYDGSSTSQAAVENSEMVLKPVAYFPDPFRQGDNILVLCEGYQHTDGSLK